MADMSYGLKLGSRGPMGMYRVQGLGSRVEEGTFQDFGLIVPLK